MLLCRFVPVLVVWCQKHKHVSSVFSPVCKVAKVAEQLRRQSQTKSSNKIYASLTMSITFTNMPTRKRVYTDIPEDFNETVSKVQMSVSRVHLALFCSVLLHVLLAETILGLLVSRLICLFNCRYL